MNIVTTNLLWKHGRAILAVVLAGLLAGSWFHSWLLIGLSLFIFSFSFFFFRNPSRECPEADTDASLLVCPADGKIVAIDQSPEGAFEGFVQRVSIFLSPMDVHVNRVPVRGSVKRVAYHPGKFFPAFLPKASELNERNDAVIMRDDGKQLLLRQITGTIARTICCWVKPGDTVQSGQVYGMMKFGSRLDVMLPADAQVHVSVGQRVRAGQTILGRW